MNVLLAKIKKGDTVYKYLKHIIVALIPIMGFFFDNKYIVIYINLCYLFLANIKSYYSISLLLLCLTKPNLLIPISILVVLLCLCFIFKKKFISLIYCLVAFLAFDFYVLKNYIYILSISSIVSFYTAGLYFYFKGGLDKDLYANKLLLSFFTSLYLIFSNKPHLCFAILIVLYQNKRDIVSLVFTLACALIKEYTLFPFYLFFLILTLKNIPINILLVILYAYFNKFNYINYLPIIINFLLYHKGTKPNVFSQTKELVDNYLAILSAKSKNLDSYDIINSKIKNLITSYCLNCSMKDSCLGKRRIDLYHYLMFESTKNMKQSKEIDYFIYNCEYKKMMDEVPKVEFGTVSNYHILKDSFNIILSEDEKKSRIINKLKSYSLKNVVYKNEDELVLSFDEYLPPVKLK